METSYKKYEDKDEEISLDYELSTLDPPNTDQVIDYDDETDTPEKLLED